MKYPPQYYRDYLQLDKILNAQVRQSELNNQTAHDEMLFITIHQAFELWFKQVLFEVDSVRDIFSERPVPEGGVSIALSRVLRVNKIATLLLDQLGILDSMTPLDFLDFRDFLHPASGFQSVQFRVFEQTLGLTEHQRLNIGQDSFHSRLDERDKKIAEDSAQKPSLFTLVEHWLEAMPFTETDDYAFWDSYRTAVMEILEGDRQTLLASPDGMKQYIAPQLAQIDATETSFQAIFDENKYAELLQSGSRRLSLKATRAVLFISLYRDYPLLSTPFRLLDALVEMDSLFSLWRFRHALMVSRMIGSRIGTGGSTGHQYLTQVAIKHRVFGEVADLSSFLIPRRNIPTLPDSVTEQLRFTFEQK